MKKNIFLSAGVATLISIAMVLAGCSGQNTLSQNQGQEASEQVVLKTTETTETSGATSSDSASAEGEVNAENPDGTEGEGDYIPVMPYISFEKKTSNVSAEGQGVIYTTSYYSLASQSAVEDYSALNEALKKYSEENSASIDNMKSQFDEFFSKNPTVKTDEGYDESIPYLAYEIRENPARLDEKITSLCEEIYLNSGTASPQILYKGYTFDNKTGQMLSLSEVVQDEAAFLEFARAKVIEILNARGFNEDTGLNADYADVVNAFDGSENNWFFNATGLEICYSADVLAPKAFGRIEVTLGYEEITPFINSDFLPAGDMIAYVDEESSQNFFAADSLAECYLINRCEKSYFLVNSMEEEKMVFKVYVVEEPLKELLSVDNESFDSTLMDLDKVECRSFEDSSKTSVYRFGAEIP